MWEGVGLYCWDDDFKDRGWSYYEVLKKSEWGGEVEISEIEDEGHVFHVFDQTCEKNVVLRNKVVDYFNN